MIRNIIASGCVAMIHAYLISRGNIGKKKPSKDQSRFEFVAATILWSHVLLYSALHLMHCLRLTLSSHRSFFYGLVRMLQVTGVLLVVVAAILVTVVWIDQHYLPYRLDNLHLVYYTQMVGNYALLSIYDARTRQLYRTECVSRPSVAPSHRSSRQNAVARALQGAGPGFLAFISVCVFVQVVSHHSFTSPRSINVFVGTSFGYKLLIQEMIK